MAIRIAQRLGIHDEGANKKHPILEAELRRRLWWSLVLFDARIAEMASYKNSLLLPTWDCKPPINANDFDLRPESKTLPGIHIATSEAFFSVIRGEIGNFIRFADFHLDFTNPALKAITRPPGSSSGVDEIDAFERRLEERYLRHCDRGNPLHVMTMWWARSQIAKCRFIRSLSGSSESTKSISDTHRQGGLSYAIAMIECDTQLMSSNLVKGYRWLLYINFPFPAYVQILQDLKKEPMADYSAKAWEVMGENCAARFGAIDSKDKAWERFNPFYKLFAGVIMAAWAAREVETAQAGITEPPPSLVTHVKSRLEQFALWEREEGLQNHIGSCSGANNVDEPVSAVDNLNSTYPVGGSDVMGVGVDHFSLMDMQIPIDVNHWGWPAGMGQDWWR